MKSHDSLRFTFNHSFHNYCRPDAALNLCGRFTRKVPDPRPHHIILSGPLPRPIRRALVVADSDSVKLR